MKENNVWDQRKLAREMIVKALNTLHPKDPLQYNKKICGGNEYHFHLTLTSEQIDSGIEAFITLNTMSAASDGEFDLYMLMQKYILEPDVRKEMNAIIRKGHASTSL